MTSEEIESYLTEVRALASRLPVSANETDGIAWRLEQGGDNGALPRDVLAKSLRANSKQLREAAEAISRLVEIIQQQSVSTTLSADVESCLSAVESRVNAATPDVPVNLAHSARKALLARHAKYNDPRNLEWKWKDAQRYERHAINAVLDLEAMRADIPCLISIIRAGWRWSLG